VSIPQSSHFRLTDLIISEVSVSTATTATAMAKVTFGSTERMRQQRAGRRAETQRSSLRGIHVWLVQFHFT